MQIDSKEGLMGLANAEGFGYIDAEISAWIEQGEYDFDVECRAEELGIGTPPSKKFDERMQHRHRRIHPYNAWHWTYCGLCATLKE